MFARATTKRTEFSSGLVDLRQRSIEDPAADGIETAIVSGQALEANSIGAMTLRFSRPGRP